MPEDELRDEIDDAAGKDEQDKAQPEGPAEDSIGKDDDALDTDRPPPGNLGPGTPS